MELLVLAIGSHATDGTIRFETYCRANQIPYQIVGINRTDYYSALTAIADNILIICCDTSNTIPVATSAEIIYKYKRLNSAVIVATEVTGSETYPVNTKYRYRNPNYVIGYRDDLLALVRAGDQFSSDIQLDYQCELFQTLIGCDADLVVHKNRIYNSCTNTYPVFLYGNSLMLNHIENYVNPGSLIINATEANLGGKVFIAAYTDQSGPAEHLNYANKVIHQYEANGPYVFTDFIASDCDYYLLLEQHCVITDTNLIQKLLAANRRIVSPMLLKPGTYFANFWGALDENMYYSRSDDYLELAEGIKRGTWNVPHVSGCILIKRDIITDFDLLATNNFTLTDKDMALTYNMREQNLFMYMLNECTYGYLDCCQ